jgi:ABC-type glycerol-3-phosphate transport system substrate-binding protein
VKNFVYFVVYLLPQGTQRIHEVHKKIIIINNFKMKKLTLILMIAIAFAGCNQPAKKADSSTGSTGSPTANSLSVEQITNDATTVHVMYFHGKQRCKTCVAVQTVAKETIEQFYADNEKVVFHEINNFEKENEALCEKYEVTWNALIIAKGEDFVEITDQAFSTAVGNPQALENLIKEEVDKRMNKIKY